MTIQSILIEIDHELARLQEVRSVLAGDTITTPNKRRTITTKAATTSGPKTRTMSPEGRARIAAAQKKRWAAQKKASK